MVFSPNRKGAVVPSIMVALLLALTFAVLAVEGSDSATFKCAAAPNPSIPVGKVCDGVADCPDASDEERCQLKNWRVVSTSAETTCSVVANVTSKYMSDLQCKRIALAFAANATLTTDNVISALVINGRTCVASYCMSAASPQASLRSRPTTTGQRSTLLAYIPVVDDFRMCGDLVSCNGGGVVIGSAPPCTCKCFPHRTGTDCSKQKSLSEFDSLGIELPSIPTASTLDAIRKTLEAIIVEEGFATVNFTVSEFQPGRGSASTFDALSLYNFFRNYTTDPRKDDYSNMGELHASSASADQRMFARQEQKQQTEAKPKDPAKRQFTQQQETRENVRQFSSQETAAELASAFLLKVQVASTGANPQVIFNAFSHGSIANRTIARLKKDTGVVVRSIGPITEINIETSSRSCVLEMAAQSQFQSSPLCYDPLHGRDVFLDFRNEFPELMTSGFVLLANEARFVGHNLNGNKYTTLRIRSGTDEFATDGHRSNGTCDFMKAETNVDESFGPCKESVTCYRRENFVAQGGQTIQLWPQLRRTDGSFVLKNDPDPNNCPVGLDYMSQNYRDNSTLFDNIACNKESKYWTAADFPLNRQKCFTTAGSDHYGKPSDTHTLVIITSTYTLQMFEPQINTDGVDYNPSGPPTSVSESLQTAWKESDSYPRVTTSRPDEAIYARYASMGFGGLTILTLLFTTCCLVKDCRCCFLFFGLFTTSFLSLGLIAHAIYMDSELVAANYVIYMEEYKTSKCRDSTFSGMPHRTARVPANGKCVQLNSNGTNEGVAFVKGTCTGGDVKIGTNGYAGPSINIQLAWGRTESECNSATYGAVLEQNAYVQSNQSNLECYDQEAYFQNNKMPVSISEYFTAACWFESMQRYDDRVKSSVSVDVIGYFMQPFIDRFNPPVPAIQEKYDGLDDAIQFQSEEKDTITYLRGTDLVSVPKPSSGDGIVAYTNEFLDNCNATGSCPAGLDKVSFKGDAPGEASSSASGLSATGVLFNDFGTPAAKLNDAAAFDAMRFGGVKGTKFDPAEHNFEDGFTTTLWIKADNTTRGYAYVVTDAFYDRETFAHPFVTRVSDAVDGARTYDTRVQESNATLNFGLYIDGQSQRISVVSTEKGRLDTIDWAMEQEYAGFFDGEWHFIAVAFGKSASGPYAQLFADGRTNYYGNGWRQCINNTLDSFPSVADVGERFIIENTFRQALNRDGVLIAGHLNGGVYDIRLHSEFLIWEKILALGSKKKMLDIANLSEGTLSSFAIIGFLVFAVVALAAGIQLCYRLKSVDGTEVNEDAAQTAAETARDVTKEAILGEEEEGPQEENLEEDLKAALQETAIVDLGMKSKIVINQARRLARAVIPEEYQRKEIMSDAKISYTRLFIRFIGTLQVVTIYISSLDSFPSDFSNPWTSTFFWLALEFDWDFNMSPITYTGAEAWAYINYDTVFVAAAAVLSALITLFVLIVSRKDKDKFAKDISRKSKLPSAEDKPPLILVVKFKRLSDDKVWIVLDSQKLAAVLDNVMLQSFGRESFTEDETHRIECEDRTILLATFTAHRSVRTVSLTASCTFEGKEDATPFEAKVKVKPQDAMKCPYHGGLMMSESTVHNQVRHEIDIEKLKNKTDKKDGEEDDDDHSPEIVTEAWAEKKEDGDEEAPAKKKCKSCIRISPYECAFASAAGTVQALVDEDEEKRPLCLGREDDFYVCQEESCSYCVCKNCSLKHFNWAHRQIASARTSWYLTKRNGVREFFTSFFLVIATLMQLPLLSIALKRIMCHPDVQCLYPNCYDDPTWRFLAVVFMSIVPIFCLFIVFPAILIRTATVRRGLGAKCLNTDAITNDEWDEILDRDGSAMKDFYADFSFTFMWSAGVEAIFNTFPLIPVVILPANSLNQAGVLLIVEILPILYYLFTRAVADPWMSFNVVLNFIFRLIIVVMTIQNRIDLLDDPDTDTMGQNMLAVSALFVVILILVIFFAWAVPFLVSRKHTQKLLEFQRGEETKRMEKLFDAEDEECSTTSEPTEESKVPGTNDNEEKTIKPETNDENQSASEDNKESTEPTSETPAVAAATTETVDSKPEEEAAKEPTDKNIPNEDDQPDSTAVDFTTSTSPTAEKEGPTEPQQSEAAAVPHADNDENA